MTIPIDGSSVRFINPDLFEARTIGGAIVIYAYHECVAVAMPDGQCFKRLKRMAGETGRKVEMHLAEIAITEKWNGLMSVIECSEREWEGIEAMVRR